MTLKTKTDQSQILRQTETLVGSSGVDFLDLSTPAETREARLSLAQRGELLRSHLIEGLESVGFRFHGDRIAHPVYDDKESIRKIYKAEKHKFIEGNQELLGRLERRALPFFANGDEINPAAINPRIELVQSPLQSDIFRYACLLWSIPVSAGYGRRMRFLIFDDSNNKLIGVLGLSDPVYCLGVRDSWVGWNNETKRHRLWHTMDAFVLGAIPPYSYLLGGKLVALMATSNIVREHFVSRYKDRVSGILGLVREPHLALLTTTAAMGRSSMLDRFKMDGLHVWKSLGMTLGWGHSHVGKDLFGEITEFMKEKHPDIFGSYKFGGGPNWKLRVMKSCFRDLGIPLGGLKHGIKREVFVAPLASNCREFLTDQSVGPNFYDRPVSDLTTFFSQRWLMPRAKRDLRYKDVTRKDMARRIRAGA